MQKLVKNQTTRVYLNTLKTVDSVKFTLVDDQGKFAKDSGNADLSSKTATLDVPSDLFYFDVTLHTTTTVGEFRIYWTATYSGLSVALEDKLDPEETVVIDAINTDKQLVSINYVMNHHLRGITEEDIKETFTDDTFRETLRDQIQTAISELEKKVDTYFTSTIITGERAEYYMEMLYEHFWTQRLFHTPVQSVESMKFKLNERELGDIPASWIQIGNKDEGLLKVLPSDSSDGFALKLVSQAGLGLALLLGGAYYVPDFFEINYTAGLDWDNIMVKEKNEIKNAISRHVALNVLPNLDINRGLSSISKSLDGASSARSFTSSAMYGEHSAAIEQYTKQESKWARLFRRNYGKNIIAEGY